MSVYPTFPRLVPLAVTPGIIKYGSLVLFCSLATNSKKAGEIDEFPHNSGVGCTSHESDVRPNCQLVACRVFKVEAASTGKRKYIPSYNALMGKNLCPNHLKVIGVNNSEGVIRAVGGICVDPTAQTTVICIRIILPPVFIVPTENGSIKFFGSTEFVTVFRGEFNKINMVILVLYRHGIFD
jgi:hypothetical protein